jgi:integrase
MRSLRALWNFAADRTADMPPNPVKLGKQWFTVPRRERIVRGDELAQFYAAVCELQNPIARDYILMMLFTGLRRSEAASLQWKDIDLSGGALRIPAERTKAKRKLDLPLTDFVRDLLIARRTIGETKFVFPSHSETGHISEPKFPLGLVGKASGVRVSAHDLRRTYITVAESADISMLALKALVNHNLGNDVTSGYVQMNVTRLREPAQLVCNKMKELCGIEALTADNVRKII